MATKSIIDKSTELKEYVAQFDIDSFCGFCAFFIRSRTKGELSGNMTMFKSMQKELTYLMALNYFNQKSMSKYFLTTDETIAELARKVNDIKESYIRDSFSELRMNVDRPYQRRALIHEQMFRFFYDNGILNYMEQEVNRIEMTYGPHDEVIRIATGLTVQDYLDCFVALENIQRAKEIEATRIFRDPIIQETVILLREVVTDDNRDEFMRTVENLPDNLRSEFMRFNECPHSHLKVGVDDLSVFVDKVVAVKFLDCMSVSPSAYAGFSYYDEFNPLEAHPLLRIGNDYMHTNGKQLLVAINDFLFTILKTQKTTSRACRAVETQLEQQTRNVVERFFSKGDLNVYQNYYVAGGLEQDLLIEIGPKVIICECKSTRLRSPLRDIDKFYTRARDDFRRSIQKGYDQADRVADLITKQKETILYDHKGKERGRVRQRSPKDVCVWVVTDKSLGPAQVDLSYMLDSSKALMDYPWSLCIDDLETFLLYLSKFPNPFSRLFDYLRFRPRLYGRVISPDELDIVGWYITNRPKFLAACMNDSDWVLVDLKLQGIFDKEYHSEKGLGFDERLRDRLWNEDDWEREDKLD
ncbi:MAG: hypothetical protein QM724_09885 [Flavobacteriales bacterium]